MQKLFEPYKVLTSNDTTLTFYLQACIEGMKQHLSKESIDVVCTSPPYNIGTNYNTYKDNLSREKDLNWMNNLL